MCFYYVIHAFAGCYDPLSAKILQQAGHQAAYVSSYAVSATQLGEPDLGLLMPPEMARRTGQICNALPVGFPVIADADAGGGSILNVKRTIRSLMATGAKGCVLDDKVWPRPVRIQQGASPTVIHRDEYIAKLLAAKEVVGDSDFFIIARTDARSSSAKHGLEDAIVRANLYIDAGADAHLIGSVRSVDELRIIGDKTQGMRVASMVEGGVTPLCSVDQLQDFGFNLCIFPVSALYAAARALTEVYGGLAQTGTTQGQLDRMVSWRAFNDILGLEDRLVEEEHFTAVSTFVAQKILIDYFVLRFLLFSVLI